MELYISEIREFVRARIDELAAEESDMLLDEIDDRNLNTTIDKSVEEAIAYIHRKAPASLMEGRILSHADLAGCVSLEDGVIDIDLINADLNEDVLRLVSFKAGDSCIKLTQAVYEDSPRARMQLNPYVQGRPDDPVIVQMDDSADFKPHYRYYTTRQTEDDLSFALRYFPYPRARVYSVSLSATRLRFETEGGFRAVHVSAEIAWSIASVPSWVTVSRHQGVGACDISVFVGANASTNENYATLEFVTEQGSAFLEIWQNAARAVMPGENTGTIPVEPDTPFLNVICERAVGGLISADPVGNTGLVELRVYAMKRLNWSAEFVDDVNNAFTITPGMGTGLGPTSYSTVWLGVQRANDGVTTRNATLVFTADGVDPVTFRVQQLPALSITPASVSLGAEGGIAQFSYVAGGNWTVRQLTSFTGLGLTGQYGGAGAGMVSVNVPANTDVSTRTIQFCIEALGISKPFSIMQVGTTALTQREVRIVEDSGTYTKAAGTYTLNLICSQGLTPSDLASYAVPNDWITGLSISQTSPTTMTLTFSLSQNTGNARFGSVHVKVAGQEAESIHSVNQEQGAAISGFSVDPEAIDVSAYASAQNVIVTSGEPFVATVDSGSPAGVRFYYNGTYHSSLNLPAGRHQFEVLLVAVSAETTTTIKFRINNSSSRYCTFTQVVGSGGGGGGTSDWITSSSAFATMDAGQGSTGMTGIVDASSDWEIRELPDWVSAEIYTSSSYQYAKFTALQNNFSSQDRRGSARLHISSSVYATVEITQRCAFIETSTEQSLAKEGTERSVSVTSKNGYAWTVTSVSDQWLTATKSPSNSLIISADENTSSDTRTATVTLSLTDYPSVTKTVSVTQAAVEVAVLPDTIGITGESTLYATCNQQTFERQVAASGPWLVDTNTLPDWLTVNYHGNVPTMTSELLVLSLSRNSSGNSREGTVKVYLSNNTSVYDELTVTQGPDVVIEIWKDGFVHEGNFVDDQDARAYEDTFDIKTTPTNVRWTIVQPEDGISVLDPLTLSGVGNATVRFSVERNDDFDSGQDYSVMVQAYDSVNTTEVIDSSTYRFTQGAAYFLLNETQIALTPLGPRDVVLRTSDSWILETDIYHFPFTLSRMTGPDQFEPVTNGGTTLGGDPDDLSSGTVLRLTGTSLKEMSVGTYNVVLKQVHTGRRITLTVRYMLRDDIYVSSRILTFIPVGLDGSTEPKSITVRCNEEWTAVASDNWIHPSVMSGSANWNTTVIFSPTLVGIGRHATYTITAGTKTAVISIYEFGNSITTPDDLEDLTDIIL